jgi:hypothetical protein
MPDPGGLKVFEGELIVTATTEAPLADTMAGSLLGDDGKPERRTTRSKTPEKSSCQATNAPNPFLQSRFRSCASPRFLQEV